MKTNLTKEDLIYYIRKKDKEEKENGIINNKEYEQAKRLEEKIIIELEQANNCDRLNEYGKAVTIRLDGLELQIKNYIEQKEKQIDDYIDKRIKQVIDDKVGSSIQKIKELDIKIKKMLNKFKDYEAKIVEEISNNYKLEHKIDLSNMKEEYKNFVMMAKEDLSNMMDKTEEMRKFYLDFKEYLNNF